MPISKNKPAQSPVRSSKPATSAPRKAPATPAKVATKPSASSGSASTSAAKAAVPKDGFVKAAKETKSDDPAKFGSFLDNVKGAFGQLGAASKPLDFSAEEKADGLKAADTMGRLAGKDSTWEAGDLANNVAQLQTSGGIKGRIEGMVARNKLFDTHKVPEGERDAIAQRGMELKEQNPNISKLHKLEGMDPSKITDPEQRARYDKMKSDMTSELSEKGLLPVGIPALQQMGGASEVLQDKMKERGLEAPAGKPVNVDQYRGLFEGKAPLRTAIGF